MESQQVTKPTTRRPRKTKTTPVKRKDAPRKRVAKKAVLKSLQEGLVEEVKEMTRETLAQSPPVEEATLAQKAESQEPQPPKKNSLADTMLGLICGLTVLLFLGSQIISQLQVQTSLVWQLRSSERQIEALEHEIALIKDNDRASNSFLERAEEVAETYNALFTDLLALAESDPDAQAIVAKYQIRNLEK